RAVSVCGAAGGERAHAADRRGPRGVVLRQDEDAGRCHAGAGGGGDGGDAAQPRALRAHETAAAQQLGVLSLGPRRHDRFHRVLRVVRGDHRAVHRAVARRGVGCRPAVPDLESQPAELPARLPPRMNRFLRWGLLGLAMAALRAEETTGPIIELPKFVVTDSRELPPPESWRYATIPGFEILTNASDRTTQRLIKDFELFR